MGSKANQQRFVGTYIMNHAAAATSCCFRACLVYVCVCVCVCLLLLLLLPPAATSCCFRACASCTASSCCLSCRVRVLLCWTTTLRRPAARRGGEKREGEPVATNERIVHQAKNDMFCFVLKSLLLTICS